MSKYGNHKTVCAGITFDSKAEAARYQELLLLQQGGAIRDLKLQPQFMLQPAFRDNTGKHHRAINYVADFQYISEDRVIIEDTKGHSTQEFRIKEKLFRFKYPDLDFRIVRE